MNAQPQPLKHIHLNNCNVGFWWFNIIIDSCPEIETIQISNCQGNKDPKILSKWQKYGKGQFLKTVDLSSSHLSQHSFSLYSIFPSVRTLNFSNVKEIELIPQLFPGVKDLDLSLAATYKCHLDPFLILKSLKFLKKLKLCGNFFSSKFLAILRTLPKKIEELNFENSIWDTHPFVNFQIRPDLIGVYENLKILNVSCSWANDSFLQIIVPHAFPNLKEIHLLSDTFYLDKTLNALNAMKHCTILRKEKYLFLP